MGTELESFRRLADATELVPFTEIERAWGRTSGRRSSRALPALAASIATVLVVATATLLMVRFESHRQAAAPPSSLEELYRHVGAQIDRPGQVLQQTARTEMDAGQYSHSAVQEQWINPGADAVRMEWTYSPEMGGEEWRQRIITTGEVRVSRDPDGRLTDVDPKAFACYGASASVSAVLGCPLPTEDSSTKIERGTHEGAPVLVLVKTGSVSSSDTNEEFTERMYVDPETLLPIAREREGTLDYGEKVPERVRTTYEHRFVEAGTLPKDYFDPRSIGYDRRSGLKGLDGLAPELEVYWLGERLEGRGKLPALAFKEVTNASGGLDPGYEFILVYNLASESYSPIGIGLEEWKASEWERAPIYGPWNSPCSEKREIRLPEGRAVIYSYYQDEMTGGAQAPPGVTPASAEPCPEKPANQFVAHVYKGGTFIHVMAYGDGERPNPYNSIEGMDAIARSLRPRSK